MKPVEIPSAFMEEVRLPFGIEEETGEIPRPVSPFVRTLSRPRADVQAVRKKTGFPPKNPATSLSRIL